MISKIKTFVKNHKKDLWIIISLGLTFKFSISFELKGNINIDYKTLVFVSIGYQIVKQISKVISKKQNTK